MTKKGGTNMKVKYHDPDMPKLEYVGGADKSNWMDLRAVKVTVIKPSGEVKTYVGFDEVTYKRDDLLKVSFGISAELPEGTEAYIIPRSSLFQNYGLFLTNHFGLIDRSYCGDNDVWMGQFLAMRDGKLSKYDRLAQFRIQQRMDDFTIEEVETLGNADRGGIGSTGVN